MDAIARSRPVLTLAIPTYERSASLSRLLHCLVAQAGIDRVEVLISDNGSTDGTRTAAEAFSDDLSIRIVGFDRNQGFDKNYHNCVVLARTEYVWVMGDDDLLTPGAVARILSAIDMNHPDLIIANGGDFKHGALVPRIDYPVEELPNVIQAMNSVGWHLCWIGTTVLRRSLFEPNSIHPSDYNAFIHLPILIKSTARAQAICYINDILIQTTVNNSEYFRNPESLVRTFGKQLFETLACLGNTSPSRRIRDKTVRAFHDRLSMFDLRFFLRLRMQGQFPLSTFFRNLRYLYRLNRWFPLFITYYLVPSSLLKITASLLKRGRKSSERVSGV